MSEGDYDSPMSDEPSSENAMADGDSGRQVNKQDTSQNENTEKTKIPPPVRPRPQTARGSRTPISGNQRKKLNRNEESTKINTNDYVDNDSSSSFNHDRSNTTKTNGSTSDNLGVVQTDAPTFLGSQMGLNQVDIPSTSRGTGSYYGKPGASSSGNSKSYTQQVNEQEARFGDQTRLLLNMFIQERVENTPVEPIIREVCPIDKRARSGFSDESLSDIALTLRRIGDDISQNAELNNAIEQIPIDSSRDIFMKVCQQIFLDGNLNWGRVVALFYFAYRLTVRTLTKGMDSVPWVRDMMSWAVDFIVKNFASWIMSRGGWTMIKEWFGMSNQTWMVLTFASMAFALWAYFRKD